MANESVPLPRPNVKIERASGPGVTENARQITIGRPGDSKSKVYINDGASPEEAIEKGIEQILNDPVTREWLP